MKKIILLFILCSTIYTNCLAQLYFTKNGRVSFFSSTPLEDIKADNNQAISTLNTSTGELQFSLLNSAFHFKKALMQEHFNADYIESAKYPKSKFKGTISHTSTVNFNADGDYPVIVSGNLDIHGVSKTITLPATIIIRSGSVSANAVFKVKAKDHNMRIPSTVRNNIAEDIEITVSCNYEKN